QTTLRIVPNPSRVDEIRPPTDEAPSPARDNGWFRFVWPHSWRQQDNPRPRPHMRQCHWPQGRPTPAVHAHDATDEQRNQRGYRRRLRSSHRDRLPADGGPIALSQGPNTTPRHSRTAQTATYADQS